MLAAGTGLARRPTLPGLARRAVHLVLPRGARIALHLLAAGTGLARLAARATLALLGGAAGTTVALLLLLLLLLFALGFRARVLLLLLRT